MKLKADRRKPMHNTKLGANTLYLSKNDPKRKLVKTDIFVQQDFLTRFNKTLF